MWGGIVAVANYIPYLGPIVCALLLFVGGLMTFADVWGALLPPAVFISFHLVEANFFTPMVVGHRLTISPLVDPDLARHSGPGSGGRRGRCSRCRC